MDNKDKKNIALIVLISSLLFFPFLGSVHLFDWDEINFAECAREMLVTGNYSQVQINFQPFWEKPPLFIWMQVLSMKIFGVTEFAARFPNALCGVLTLVIIYIIGKKIYDRKFALTWVFVYASSFLTFLYFKSGIIDPWFNLFIFLGIYFSILFTNNPASTSSSKYVVFAGIMIGLSVLTKGPVGLLIYGLTAGLFVLFKRFKNVGGIKHLFLFIVSFSLIGFSWFIIEILKGNGKFVQEFVAYQLRLLTTEDSAHGGFMLYHFVVLLIGCFPASIFFLQSHKASINDTPFQKHSKRWMIILFWVVLILFSIVKTKIIHYSSMCWFPLTFLASYSIIRIQNGEISFKKWVATIGIIVCGLLGLLFIIVPLADFIKPALLKANLIKDTFAVENLKADGGWIGFEWFIGVVFVCISVFSFLQLRKGKFKFIQPVFYTSLFTVFTFSLLVIPRIERYTQGAAIDFYKTLKDKDCYLETAGFKSYAYLFYSNKQAIMNTPPILKYANETKERELKEGINDPHTSFSRYCALFMLYNPVDKPAYIVIRIMDEEDYAKRFPDYKKLYSKNGFVFLKKEASIIN